MHPDSNTNPRNTPAKPQASKIRPEITRLPEINAWRRFARQILRKLTQLLVFLFIRLSLKGKENIPKEGAALLVLNHLGDADGVIAVALINRPLDFLAKSELYDFPILGWLLQAYGLIWVHRGQPDRRALQAAAEGLKEGRLVGIAPEGRESVTGALEEGAFGAAYLAYKTGAAVIPIAYTHTENWRIRENILRLRKTPITVTIGTPFHIETHTGLANDN